MKGIKEFDLSWIDNPEIFSVNRRETHSDHLHYTVDGLIVDKIDLNGIWNFKYHDNLEEVDYSFIECDERIIDTITVPSHIQLQGYGEIQYVNQMYPWDGYEDIMPPMVPKDNPIGIYTRQFKADTNYLNNRTYINFEGVESAFYVFLNGKFIGYSEDSFTDSEFEITDYIEENNRIAVMVLKYCSGSWLEDQDFWRFSGIFRGVSVHYENPGYISDLDIRTYLNEDYTKAAINISCKTTAESELKIEVAGVEQNFQPEENISLEILNPKLWSSEIPNLYEVKLTSFIDGKLVDTVVLKTGIREIKIEDKIIKVNGKRLVIKGVNRHEWHCEKGRAINKDDIREDLLICKRNNINAIRTSHYPNNSVFYRLCDEMGFYVIDETNLETHGTWQVNGVHELKEKTLPNDKPEWRENVLDRGRTMYLRDRNHPSIIMWSLGNESYGGTTLLELSNYFREVDNTRLVHYEGVFFDNRYPESTDVYSRMYAYIDDAENYLRDNPEKPMVQCEFSHAMGNSLGNFREYFELTEKYPMYQGGFVWDFIDQGLKIKDSDGKEFLASGLEGKKPTDGYFCANGIVLADKSETSKTKELKYVYQPVSFKINGTEITVVNNYMFKNLENSLIKWTLKNDGKEVYSSSFNVDVDAGSSFTREINYQIHADYNELVLYVEYIEDDLVIAYDEAIVKSGTFEFTGEEYAEVVVGDCNIGFRTDNAHILISNFTGELKSIRKGNKEMLSDALKLNYYRAYIDNDYGNQNSFKWAQFKIASEFQFLKSYELFEDEARIVLNFINASSLGFESSIEYQFFKNDTFRVKIRTSEFNTTLPCFGFNFKMKKEYANLRYYGNTIADSAVDRKASAILAYKEERVEDQYVNYIHPQDNGDKTDLRYLEVVNKDNCGLRIFATKAFTASVLPYTACELENAENETLLPPFKRNVVTVNAFKAGVGGDDSWGAQIHDEYTLSMKKGLESEIYIKVI